MNARHTSTRRRLTTGIVGASILALVVPSLAVATEPSPPTSSETTVATTAAATRSKAKAGRVVVSARSIDPEVAKVPSALSSGVTAVSMGQSHALALKGGRVYAWGGPALRSTVPAAARSGVIKISAGSYHNLAIKKGGGVIAWGDYAPAQEVPAVLQSGVSAIAGGHVHSLALKDGRVYAWGTNFYNEIDVPKAARSNVKAIAAGENISVALRKDGRVIVWGRNDAPPWDLKVPGSVRGGVSSIAVGRWHILAVKQGRVIAFGSRLDLDYMVAATTVPAAAMSKVTAVAAGDASYALKNGSLIRWGGSTEEIPLPTGKVLGFDSGSPGLIAIVAN